MASKVCAFDGCRKPSGSSLGDNASKYCAAHYRGRLTCAFDGCTDAAQAGKSGKGAGRASGSRSKYCSAHYRGRLTCGVDGCTNAARGAESGGAARCKSHAAEEAECRWRGCSLPSGKSLSTNHSQYCATHYGGKLHCSVAGCKTKLPFDAETQRPTEGTACARHTPSKAAKAANARRRGRHTRSPVTPVRGGAGGAGEGLPSPWSDVKGHSGSSSEESGSESESDTSAASGSTAETASDGGSDSDRAVDEPPRTARFRHLVSHFTTLTSNAEVQALVTSHSVYKTAGEPGVVYCFASSALDLRKMVKIGSTNEWARRKKAHERHYGTLHGVHTVSTHNRYLLESMSHKLMEADRDIEQNHEVLCLTLNCQRKHREWFFRKSRKAVTPEEGLAAIVAAKKFCKKNGLSDIA